MKTIDVKTVRLTGDQLNLIHKALTRMAGQLEELENETDRTCFEVTSHVLFYLGTHNGNVERARDVLLDEIKFARKQVDDTICALFHNEYEP